MSCNCNPESSCTPAATQAPAAQQSSVLSYQPSFDLIQTDSGLTLRADMPGVRPDSIDITVERTDLRVLAKVAPRSHTGARVLREEYGVGDYHLHLQLREPVDAPAVTASYEHGVLTLNLPRPAQMIPRRIPITGTATGSPSGR